MVHSIVIGYGLAGCTLAAQLKWQDKSFVIIDNPTQNATRNAAGVLNPTVLKRYTLAWKAPLFLDYAYPFYQNLEQELKASFLERIPIHRHFFNAAEQNLWVMASNSSALEPFLNPDFSRETEAPFKGAFGYGKVIHTARMDTTKALHAFEKSLNKAEFLQEQFDYKALEIKDFGFQYKNIRAKHIVFCEGFGLQKNPYFNMLPLQGLKGEFLLIKAPEISHSVMIKARGIFIIPLPNKLFWVGATFHPKDKSPTPTPEGREWLTTKLEQILNVPYEIVAHKGCMRPTISDRRPLLGAHPEIKNMYLFNGLGTRGVLMAPLLSKWLINQIELDEQIPETVNLNRFDL